MSTIRNPPAGGKPLPPSARSDPAEAPAPRGERGPIRPVGAEERQHAQQTPAAAPAHRLSTADAERLAQQSGFVRGARPRRRLGLDADEVSGGPFPLPLGSEDEDAPESAWEQGSMDHAMEHLSVHHQQVEALAGRLGAATAAGAAAGHGPIGLAGALVGGAFVPTPADLGRLSTLAERAEDAALAAAPTAASASLRLHFNVDVGQLPAGLGRLAAALVAAGRAEAVVPAGEGLDGVALAEGLGRVVSAGSQSIGDARQMHEGIHRQRGQLSTFVPKKR